MNEPISITTLLNMYNNTVHPPISDATGVSNAIDWLNIVQVFCLEQPEAVPNRDSIIIDCETYTKDIKVLDTDYAKVNNYVYQIRSKLYAITQQVQ